MTLLNSPTWDPTDWDTNAWIGLHGPILFSIFFHIISLIYLYKIWRRRKETDVAKHIQIRNPLLFSSHMLVNHYWISIHPTIIFIFMVIGVDTPLLFCFTYFVISVKLFIWCNRMWILYWQYSVRSLQIKILWKQQINTKYNSFLLQYPILGRLSFTMTLTGSIMFLFDTFLFWIAYETDFDQTFHVSIAAHFFLWVLFLNFLCIRLHRKHNVDNYKIRSEFTWLCILFSTDFGILVTPYFVVQNNWIRVWIIIDGLALCNLLMIIITTNLILNNSGAHHLIPNKSQSYNVVSLLKHPSGINAFAEWLVAEFNVESLLFTIEACQFRTLLKEYISENNAIEYTFDDVGTNYFEIASNIPLTEIINTAVLSDNSDTKARYDFNQIAQSVFEKYIKNEYSDLAINISYEQRQHLSEIDFENVDIIALYHVFDEVLTEMLKVLHGPLTRFSKTMTYQQLIEDKANIEHGILQEIKNMDSKVHMIFFQMSVYLENKCCTFNPEIDGN